MLRSLLLGLPLLGLITTGLSAADFYVDPAGDDSRDGRSTETAWKTLARIEKQPLHPGDRVRLRGGVEHQGMLAIRHDGIEKDPIRINSYTTGEPLAPAIVHGQNLGMDASASHLVIENITFKADGQGARAGLMIYAHRNLTNIIIRDCTFIDNAGRGIWISGEPNKSAADITITRNVFINTAGSPLQITKLAGGSIDHNYMENSCSRPVDDWQAGVRVWSPDVHDLSITANRIRNGIHGSEQAAGMGVHVDEVGSNVVVKDNDIFDCDASGIEVENTRGVRVENNWLDNVHTGVFIYRAGHEHVITRNTVDARALGIVLQGHRAAGVNAGPEIEVEKQLFSRNQVSRNIAVAKQWASLKVMGGAEVGKTRIDFNYFGEDRASLIEWGNREFSTLAAFEAIAGDTQAVKAQAKTAKRFDRPVRLVSAQPAIGAERPDQK